VFILWTYHWSWLYRCLGVGYISLSVYLYQHLCVAIYLKIYLVVHLMVSVNYQGAYATIFYWINVIFSTNSDISALGPICHANSDLSLPICNIFKITAIFLKFSPWAYVTQLSSHKQPLGLCHTALILCNFTLSTPCGLVSKALQGGV
jgi:hypothetical protein